MPRSKSSTLRRAWYVLGPVALILTGAGWLALGAAYGMQTHCAVPAPVAPRPSRVQFPDGPQARRTASRQRPPSPSWVHNGATGASYAVIPARTWREGQAQAASLGGRLVTVDDATEQAWLVEKFGGKETFWIGLTDANTEGRWRWAGGEPVSYKNWATDEPNNLGAGEHFGVMNWRGPGSWNDMSPSSAGASDVRAAIVERRHELEDANQRWRNETPNAFDVTGKPIAAPPDFGAGLPSAMAFDTGFGEWSRWSGADRMRSHRAAEIVWDDERGSNTIQFTRVGGGSDGSQIGIARDVRIDLADYENLQFALDVNPMAQSLSGGGWASGCEYPVAIELSYLDQNGIPHRWQHGFYFKGDDRYDGSSKIPAGRWHSYASPRLSLLTPICADAQRRVGHNRYHKSRIHAYDPSSRPAIITRIVLFGGGWDFSGRAANLRFGEGSRLVAGRRRG